jgi:hypothetical protein
MHLRVLVAVPEAREQVEGRVSLIRVQAHGITWGVPPDAITDEAGRGMFETLLLAHQRDRVVQVPTMSSGQPPGRLAGSPSTKRRSSMAVQGANGKVTRLRVHEPSVTYGGGDRKIDVDVVFRLQNGAKNLGPFGFKMWGGTGGPAQYGMFQLLKDAHLHDKKAWIAYDDVNKAAKPVLKVVLGGSF